MNRARRKRIDIVLIKLQEVAEELGFLAEEELEAFENLPDSIQESERGEAMEETASNLEEVQGEVEEIASRLESIGDA